MFQRHRPGEGDCKCRMHADVLGRVLCFSAIAPGKGTARLSLLLGAVLMGLFQRHRPGEGDCKGKPG